MKTIGIIGGSTHIATAAYYRIITSTILATLSSLHTGEIIIVSMNLHHSARFVHGHLWDEGAEYLNSKALALERAGADFVICVSNTWHRVADKFMKRVNIPLLHIAMPLVEAIQEKEMKKVGLLGTKATMEGRHMKDILMAEGIEVVVPNEFEMDVIDRVIFEELSHDKFSEESREFYLGVVDKLCAQGAKGIILGCTEIGLLVREQDRPGIVMFDTLRLHARAAVKWGIAQEMEEMGIEELIEGEK